MLESDHVPGLDGQRAVVKGSFQDHGIMYGGYNCQVALVSELGLMKLLDMGHLVAELLWIELKDLWEDMVLVDYVC